MQLGKARSQAVGKLHRDEDQCAGARHSVDEQPPADGLVVLPNGIRWLDQESLIVIENVGGHGGDEDEDQMLRTERVRIWATHSVEHRTLPLRLLAFYPGGQR